MSTTKSATEKPKAPRKRATRSTAAKKRAPRKTAAKTTSKANDDKYVVAQHTLSLVALSPFRFPVDMERLAINTARIGGVAFVFLGLIFTYNYLETEVTNIVVENTQVATVASARDEVSAYTPRVEFSYAPAGLNGEHITVNVPSAESVELYAFVPEVGEYVKLGMATQTADDRWEFIWDTIEVPAGQYWIKALVTNEYGMYDRSDSRYVTVE